MGVGLGRRYARCCLYDSVHPTKTTSCIETNPNPIRFELLHTKQIGKNLVVKIKYPDCTNFEGTKIILYKNRTVKEIQDSDFIDPHFSKTGLMPFARFVPTDEGWEMACKMASLI